MMALTWESISTGRAHLGFSTRHFSSSVSLRIGLGRFFLFLLLLYMYLSIYISAVAQGFTTDGKVDA